MKKILLGSALLALTAGIALEAQGRRPGPAPRRPAAVKPAPAPHHRPVAKPAPAPHHRPVAKPVPPPPPPRPWWKIW